MDAHTLRRLFLDYFQEHEHALIDGAPLIPEHDPSVLFTTAGMHPLVPYLLGERHPAGTRLADCQPCLRTDDIAEVGDAVHLTFFEMLGSWSLGAYGKEESLRLSYTFLTERLAGTRRGSMSPASRATRPRRVTTKRRGAGVRWASRRSGSPSCHARTTGGGRWVRRDRAGRIRRSSTTCSPTGRPARPRRATLRGSARSGTMCSCS